MYAHASEDVTVSLVGGMCEPKAVDQTETNFIVGVSTRVSNIHTIIFTVCFKTR
jgi:MFS superfamily sulfate permease-like transporter